MTDFVEILRIHNEWRRGAEIEMPQPKLLGDSIDAAIAEIERLRGLDRRLSAAMTVIKSKEKKCAFLSRQVAGMHEALATLESERAANAVLTEEVERLRSIESAAIKHLAGGAEYATLLELQSAVDGK